jgi:hypothetical protein
MAGWEWERLVPWEAALAEWLEQLAAGWLWRLAVVGEQKG